MGPASVDKIYVHVAAPGVSDALIAGLVGVLVGGLLHLLIERRLDRQRMAARVRAAGKLLSSDLLTKLGAMVVLEQAGRWIAPTDIPGLTDRDAWIECRADLAYSDIDTWLTVARLYVELDGIEGLAARSNGTSVTPEQRQRLKDAMTTISEAIALVDVFRRPRSVFNLKGQLHDRRQRREVREHIAGLRKERADRAAGQRGG